jgi:vacuolar-type H+-ATPase subunit H
MQEVLNRCIEGCSVNELDYNAQELYDKYFKKKEDNKDEEKKEITSTTSPLDTK